MKHNRDSFQELARTAKGRRLFEQELLVVSATELVSEILEKNRVSRSELARRIGKSRAFVTQLLRGSRNMTLRTLADLAWALDARIELQHSNGNLTAVRRRAPNSRTA